MQTLLKIPSDTPVYVNAGEVIQLRLEQPFIQRSDLIEVLKDYFSGNLDEPESYELICQDLRDWHSNSLWAFTDSAQIARILDALEQPYKQVILFHFNHWRCSVPKLETYYTLYFQGEETFSQFIDICLEDALQAFSDILIKEL